MTDGSPEPAAHLGVRPEVRGRPLEQRSHSAALLEPSGGLIESSGGCSSQVLTRRAVTVARRRPSPVETQCVSR